MRIGPATIARHVVLVAFFAAIVLPLGPYDIMLLNTPRAPAAKGTARLVLAQSPFGVTVAANRGLDSNVFLSVAEAREWLDTRDP